MAGFHEHDYRVSWQLTPSELRQVGELRADVFCRELGWAGSPSDRTEQDEFDGDSTYIAVLDGQGEVIGSFRLIKPRAQWMLDTVFSGLAPAGRVTKGPDTAEASRLAVSRKWRGKRLGNGMRACDLIYKAAYAYCRLNGIRYLYMVTSDIVLEHMQRAGLPCRELSAMRQMPDGVRAATVVLDWHRLRETPALASWYASGWQMPPVSSTSPTSPTSPASPVERVLPALLVANSGQRPVAETSPYIPLRATGTGAPAVPA